MNFQDIKGRINVLTKTVKITDDLIFNVKQYLPIKDKYDIIDIVLQNAQENAVYNPIKMDMYFNTYVVLSYTDIEFTDEEKLDVETLYDTLSSSGILDEVIKNIPETEYNYLYDSLLSLSDSSEKYNSTIAAMIQTLINTLPEQAEAVEKIIQNFDKEKLQQVIDFATAANGNRDISTNEPIDTKA